GTTIPPAGAGARATGSQFPEWFRGRSSQMLLLLLLFATHKTYSKHMQGRRILRITMRPHQDFHILIERYEKTQQALHRKLPELAAQHLGDIGLPDTEVFGRIPYAEILEHVPPAAFISLFAHRSLSFAICSASRSRCFISSMSRRGVSRPAFDFFWKA